MRFYAGLGNGEGLPSNWGFTQSPPFQGLKEAERGVLLPASPSAGLARSGGCLRGRGCLPRPRRRPGSQDCCKWVKLQAG